MTRLSQLATLVLAIGACNSERAHRTDRFAIVTEQRDLRLFGLRAERAMLAGTPHMLAALATQLPLTASARAEVLARVLALERRLDDFGARIDELQNASPDEWTARDAAATDAMRELEAARDAAWSTLGKAHRVDHPS